MSIERRYRNISNRNLVSSSFPPVLLILKPQTRGLHLRNLSETINKSALLLN